MRGEGKIVVCGGYDRDNHPLSTCEAYSAAENAWRPFPSMNTKVRKFALVATADNSLYAFGGDTGNGFTDTIEKYEDGTNWTVIATRLPWKMNLFSAVRL